MALFSKKKKTAADIKSEIRLLQQELEAIEGPAPAAEAKVETEKAEVVKTAAPSPSAELNRSSSNALFATLSHELRTPLNGVLGMTQLLKETVDNSQLDTLESCAQHMQSVLHTLVNLSKIQQQWGNLPEHREWINIHDLLEQIKKNLTHRAATRHLKVEVQHQNNTLRLRGDYDHLTNIIETAILGSLECTDINQERAPVTLQIRWQEIDGELKLVIENPLEVMPQNRGFRISEVSELTTGNGHSRIRMEFLYWAVSIAILEHYKGGMIASKMEDGGVRTTLVFTMESMEASPSSQRPVGGLSLSLNGKGPNPLLELPFCMKVLIVEDDPINRDLMTLLLERIGQKAEVARNGQAALDLLYEGASYDLILMDIDMPVLDGMTTARAIRMGEAGEIAEATPIVAATAFNTLSDQSKFKKAGMDYFLSKPVSLKDLRSILIDVTRKEH